MIDPLMFASFVRAKLAGPMTDLMEAPTHKGFAGTSDPGLVKKLLKRHPDLAVKEVPGGGNAYYVGKKARGMAGRPGDSFIGMPAGGATRDMMLGGVMGAKSPEIIAHELGHREFGRTGVGKILQHPVAYGMGMKPGLSLLAGGGAGYLEGRRKSKQEARGEKATKIPYGALAPLAVTAPMLASEGMASRNALKMLRESGASAAQLSQARGSLGKAFASYLAMPAIGLAAYGGGRYMAAQQAKHEAKQKLKPKSKPQEDQDSL